MRETTRRGDGKERRTMGTLGVLARNGATTLKTVCKRETDMRGEYTG